MKHQIPPELDSTMWLLAEKNDHRAIEEFGLRFPDLRPELGKRLEMVRSLRGMSDGVRTDRIPEFQLRKAEPVRTSPRLLAVSFGLVAAAFALGAYAIVSNQPTPHPVPTPAPIPTAMPTPNTGPVYSDNLPGNNNSVNPPPTPQETPVMPTDLPDYAKPQDFAFDHTKLATAIRMIANAAHLRIDIAPGLPDIEISASYPQMSPVDVLKQLGADYGFTPFAEENGHVWVVPARDSVSPTTAPTAAPSPTPDLSPKPIYPSSSPSEHPH